jgi:hypothetical protein
VRKTWVVTAIGAVLTLGACSGGPDSPSSLPRYTGGASTGPGSPGSSPSATPQSRPASGKTSGPAGKTQTFTIRRGKLPAGLTGDRAAAAEAWLAYWEYIAVADSIPAIDPATSGSVMTGAAATKVYAYTSMLKKAKTHVIGTVGVDTTSALVHGSTATLCGRLQMNAFEFNAKGIPVESILPTVMFFKGTASKSGPTWRISDYVNLKKPC